MDYFRKIVQLSCQRVGPAGYRIVFLLLLLFVLFTAAQTGYGAVEEGNCDDINELVSYGVIGEAKFDYGKNSVINGNTITGNGNTPTPTGGSETIDVNFPPIVPENFPPSGSTDLNPSSGPVAPGSYKTIEFEATDGNDTVTFTGGDYYIDKLIVKKNSTVQLAPGNYFIEDKFELGENSELIIVPSGQVNLYIKKDFKGNKQSQFNGSGDTGNFVVYLYDGAKIDIAEKSHFNGIIYSPGDSSKIDIKKETEITGAILGAGKVKIGKESTLNYPASVQSEVLDALGCTESAGPDHFRIDHPGSALTCQSATVTVRACADADCSTVYTDDVVIDLSPAGWIGGDSQTLSGGSGVLRLRHTTPETVTLSVSSSDPAADGAPQCVDGAGGSSCNLTFHAAGFLFDVPDHTACSPVENIRIAAVRADATAEHCIGDDSFANTTRDVDVWFSYQEPVTGARPVFVNGNAVSGASPGTTIAISFDAQAESLLSINYGDAGRVGLTARFEGSGEEAGLVMVGSDSFVAAPHHLRVRTTTDGTTPLNNTTAAGNPRWPAGETFFVEVEGVCADDSLTPNFATATTLAVAAAVPAPGIFSGGPLSAASYSGGVATGTATYSEVGTVTLQAEATDYLGSGIDIVGTSVVGRFTPHRFDVSLNSPEFAPACTAGAFSYIGQSFGYTTPPVITVTARNKSGGTTANYTGDWWKITGTTLTGKVYQTASGTLDLSAIPAGDPVISDLGSGIGLLTFGDGGGIRFVRDASPEVPFNAEISLAINVLDADGIAATANPVTFGAAIASNGIPFTGGAKLMRWGRLALQNAYGSEQVPLAMPYRAESFNGSTFVTNTLDSCTGTALDLLGLSNNSGTVTADNPISVGTGNSSATLSNPFATGDAGMQFSAPGSEGYIHVQVDLSSLPWLRYDWNGDGIQEGPTARATFGIYKGRPSLIYLRETYR